MSERGQAPVPPGVRLAQLEELELSIEKLVAGGEGLGRFEGVPIFVPRSAPGDRVRVRLVERHPDYGRAEIVTLLAPGPGRRTPPCPHFMECGGCDLQHLDEEHQLEYKVLAAKETLRRMGGVDCPEPAEVAIGKPWSYRLRCQLHTQSTGGVPRVGYYARASHRLFDLTCCPVLVPELESKAVALAEHLPSTPPRRIDLAAGDGGSVSSAPVVEGVPHGALASQVGAFTYSYDARCFFQGHRELLPRLVERVVGEWTGKDAYDLYGGVGLFALPLAHRYRCVVLVEADRIAARFARSNFRQNRIGGGDVVVQAMESWIDRLPPAVDRVIVDPPRSGLPAVVAQRLLERRPARLTYVSCHEAALARDLSRLVPAFRLESICFFDLFPQTGHLETVAQLVAA